jgi:hypothetical protein
MRERKKALISALRSANPLGGSPMRWRGRGLARVLLLLFVAAAIAAAAAAFGIARDYGYLRASILTGSPVAQDKLDVAAFVMQEDAEFLRTVIHQYGLDIVAPQDLHAQERPLGRHHRIALIGAKTGRVIFDGPWSEGAPNFLQCVSLEVARLPVMQQSVC